MRRPLSVALAATLAMLLMTAPLLDLQLGAGSHDGLPQQLESVQGLRLLAATAGSGSITPTSIVVDAARPGAALEPAVSEAIDRLVDSLQCETEAAYVHYDPASVHSIDATGRYALVQIAGRNGFGAAATLAFVDRLRHTLVPAAAFPASTSVHVGGAPAAGGDYLALVRASFPWLVCAILFATYVLLVVAFRSLLLPLKAIVLNLLSIGSAYGLTVAAFTWGWGEPFGLIRHTQIDAWIPVLVFAMLFGLSMDYEVFLVSRIREYWDRGASNEEAVVAGLARTGRLVTAAGVIMCAAFLGFVAGSVVELQQFGFALAASIFVDVTVVRGLLLPATMKLFGTWNWHLPAWLARFIPATSAVPSAPDPRRERP